MSFKGVQINKINGGLGGADSPDRVAVMVLGCGAIADTLEVNAAYKLLQLADAEALGITAEHDAAENRFDHHHLSEAFRLSPETAFYLIAVPAATKVSDLKNLDAFKTALRRIDGVNIIAVAGMTADAAAGELSALGQSVTGAQLLVDHLAEDHIYIDAVLIEGIGSYLAATLSAMENLRNLASPNVSVVIAQDSYIGAIGAGYASVGSVLGMLLVRAVHENLGSVDIESKPSARKGEQDYTLTEVKTGSWLWAGLSNGKPFHELSFADQRQLDQLGYIYAGAFNGYAGYYFSNSHTCDQQESDYCFIERNCIWNKAARIIRKTLIPRIRSKVEADPATGYIKNSTLTDWDGRVRKALEPMLAEGNCAEFDVYIHPHQAAVSTAPFKIGVKIVADGVVHEFDIDLGFTNKI